jgi:Raf kinase inhibitor-like YbhB/YbcL family protein
VRSLIATGLERNRENDEAFKFDARPEHDRGITMALVIRSSAFGEGQEIPPVYTCDGRDISPPLSWSGLPAEAKSLALIVDDPDAPDPAAPKMTWVHWIIYNLSPSLTGLPVAVRITALPAGAREGLNGWRNTKYSGPCPPVGRHRYFFKLYALDAVLPNLKRPTKGRLEEAMREHIVAQATLIGTYQHTLPR